MLNESKSPTRRENGKELPVYTLLATDNIWLAGHLAFPIRVAAWATLSGVLSMGLYAITSPQRRLCQLRERSARLNASLVNYDGDFSGAMNLVRENLWVSLTRLAYALGPSFLAGAPVVLILVWMMQSYPPLGAAPSEWLQSWLAGFLLMTTLVALGVKFVFRIS